MQHETPGRFKVFTRWMFCEMSHTTIWWSTSTSASAHLTEHESIRSRSRPPRGRMYSVHSAGERSLSWPLGPQLVYGRCMIGIPAPSLNAMFTSRSNDVCHAFTPFGCPFTCLSVVSA